MSIAENPLREKEKKTRNKLHIKQTFRKPAGGVARGRTSQRTRWIEKQMQTMYVAMPRAGTISVSKQSPTETCTHTFCWMPKAGECSVPDNFLHRLREVVKVPHHCLVTVPVAMHTAQLGIAGSLRIQGLSTSWWSPQADTARVVRSRCRCRQHSTIPQCKKDNLEPLQFLLRLLDTSLKSHLWRIDDVLAMYSPVLGARGTLARAWCRSTVLDWCGTSSGY